MMHRIIGNNEVAAAVNEQQLEALEKRRIYRESLKTEKSREPSFSPIVSINPQWTSLPLASPSSIEDLQQLNIPSLWSHYGLRGEGVNVYILDSGFNGHSEFTVRSTRSFLPGVDDISDGIGHGTWAAGKIGGSKVGIAPKCNLHIGRVLDGSGTGSAYFAVKALEWVLREPNPHIIHLSLGSTTPYPELGKLILQLQQRGVLVVASGDGYPGKFDGCLTVNAVQRAQQKAEKKLLGGNLNLVVSCESYSTYLQNGYRSMEGTLMATSMVTGVVALAYALLRSRGRSTIEMRKMVLDSLLSTSQALSLKERASGFGGIDATKFLAAVSSQT